MNQPLSNFWPHWNCYSRTTDIAYWDSEVIPSLWSLWISYLHHPLLKNVFPCRSLGHIKSRQVWTLLEDVLVPESHTNLIKSSLNPDLNGPITRPHLWAVRTVNSHPTCSGCACMVFVNRITGHVQQSGMEILTTYSKQSAFPKRLWCIEIQNPNV